MSAANALAAGIGSTDERDVTITRLIDAPRELVFAMWTDPRHFARWARPEGFAEIHFDEIDMKVGGLIRVRLRTAEGSSFTSRRVLREITPPSQLAYDETCEMDGIPFHQAREVVSFTAEAGKTRLTIHARLTWVEGRPAFFTKEMMREGWAQGWSGNFDKLQTCLPRATFASSPGLDLVLARQVAAPREAVFAAWTDAKQLAQWWGPDTFTNPVCESDPRLGGAWNVTMRAPDGTDYPIRGVYQEIVPFERLVIALDLSGHPAAWHAMIRKFRSEHGEAADAPEGGLVLIVTLEERNGGTWLTVIDRFTSASERDAHRDLGAVQGWTESVERLAALLGI